MQGIGERPSAKRVSGGLSRFAPNLVWWLAIISASAAWAQQPSAAILGFVSDSSGARVAKAQVKLFEVAVGLERFELVDATGAFAFTGLTPGSYQLEIRAEGFKRLVESGLTLRLHDEIFREIELEVGGPSESISVTADTAVLNFSNGPLKGEVTSSEEIRRLPLESRNYIDLALLTPGVVRQTTGKGSGLAVNGARPDQTNFYVDGFSNRSPDSGEIMTRPNFDAVREFRMETAGYSAEYGRFAGGILHAALRSGSNSFHGAFFEQARNEIFDARNSFRPRRLPLRRHQFGAAVGGPIARNRTFFRASYEGVRERTGRSRFSMVPTALERQGDFSETTDRRGRPIILADPQAGADCRPGASQGCFPGNRIPSSRLDPVGVGLANLYPLPNDDSRLPSNFLAIDDEEVNSDSFVAKIDHQATDLGRLSFRLQTARDARINPLPLRQFGGLRKVSPLLLGASWTQVLSSRLLLQVQGGVTQTEMRTDGLTSTTELARSIGIPIATDNPEFAGMPVVSVSGGYPALGSSTSWPDLSLAAEKQIQASLQWAGSGHDLKWGFGYIRSRYRQTRNDRLRGRYSFDGGFTNAPIGDLLLGAIDGTERRHEPGFSDLQTPTYGFFVNDNYRIHKRLTLNLGLRYEINKPFVDRYDRLANYIPELNQVVISSDRTLPEIQQRLQDAGIEAQFALARDVGLPRALVQTDYKNLAPRVGFAWSASSDGKTVLRGGYGIFYAGLLQDPLRIFLGDNFPIKVMEYFGAGPLHPISFADPFPQNLSLESRGVVSADGVERRQPTGYLQNWNLTIERRLGRATVLETAYVGSKGTHLTRWYNLNEPLRSMELFDPRVNPRDLFDLYPRPHPDFGRLRYMTFGANSNYHAGQVSLRRQATEALMFRANYSFSKSIDEASSFISDQLAIPFNPGLDRGRSSFDRTHVFNFAGSWDLPGMSRGPLAGWRVSAIFTFLSGRVFHPVFSRADLDQGESERPNRIAHGVPTEGEGRRGLDYPWYDPDAFEVVPCALCKPSQYGFQPFQPGNSGRNILTSPGVTNLDLALAKGFGLTEGSRLEFRAEAFNALNNVNLGNPEEDLRRPTAGTIRGALPARVMQLSIRLEF